MVSSSRRRKKPINKKVIKSSKEFTLESLIGSSEPSQEEYDDFSEKLIKEDKEIDFELFGKFIDKTDRIYTDKNLNPVYNVELTEKFLILMGISKKKEYQIICIQIFQVKTS